LPSLNVLAISICRDHFRGLISSFGEYPPPGPAQQITRAVAIAARQDV
jgi:hypothetical protein